MTAIPDPGDTPGDKDLTDDQANVSAAMDYIGQLGWADVDHTVPAAQETAVATLPVIKKIRKVRAPKHDFNDGCGRVFAHKHENGGGWVADTAHVAKTVLCERRAQVYHRARVKGQAKLQNYAQVCGCAVVSGSKIAGHAYVAGFAQVTGGEIIGNAMVTGGKLMCCTLTDRASVYGDPLIHYTNLYGYVRIYGAANVLHSEIKGWARISNRAHVYRAHVEGYVEITDEANVTNAMVKNNCYGSANHMVRVVGIVKSHRRDDVAVETLTPKMLIHESALVVGTNRDLHDLQGAFHMGGDAVILNSSIRVQDLHGNPPGSHIDVNKEALIVGLTARGATAFDPHNTSGSQRARAVFGPSRAAFDFNVLAQPRIIMPVSQEGE